MTILLFYPQHLDNAGLYQFRETGGLGMNLVDRRIKLRYGKPVRTGCRVRADRLTRVTIRLPMEEAMLTVLIVDDETPAREELRALLEVEPDIEIVGECANAVEALVAIKSPAPDVAFLHSWDARTAGLEPLSLPVRDQVRRRSC